VLITLASAAGALAVLLAVVLVSGGGRHGGRPAGVASADTTQPAETTASLVEATATTVNLQPVNTSPAPATTAVSSATTSSAPPAPVVSSAGAVLTAPSSAVTRPMGPGCATLADPGSTSECGVAHAKGGDLVWAIETGPGGPGWRSGVWAHVGGATWREVLAVADDDGGRFGHIKARVAYISGDGFDEIAFGFGVVGTQHLLQVDIVDGSRKVVAHRDFAEGAARVTTGQLDGWSGRESGGSPQWVHEVIRYQSGAWRLTSSTSVAKSAVPPSQL